jgi:RES domain-containing protein
MPRSRPVFTTFTNTVYRATSYDVPLWVNPNRRAGRWNIAWTDSTQYACLDPEAPFAEMLRGEDLRSEKAAATYRTSLWQLRVDEGAIVDYSTFEKADAVGFSADALVDDDHERCQAEAEFLKTHGARGVLAPCAALPGSINLTLFGPRTPIDWNATVRLASGIPAQRLVSSSAPPTGLTARVRFYGELHPAYVAYARGNASS